jgi:tRNA threonylcarbamoyladenosine biosynthesis protein TsaB
MIEPRATGDGRLVGIVLALDTAGSACSVAIGDADRMLAHERHEMRHGHAEALLPMIDLTMRAAGLTARRISRVAVSVGPGGFTGIRAGLAAAHGVALACSAPLTGVTSFAAVAAALPPDDHPLLVALDSRREDFYAQLFTADGRSLVDPMALLPGDLVEFVSAAIGAAPLRIAGDMAAKAAALFAHSVVITAANSAPDARGVLAAAGNDLYAGAPRALYLRPPDVSFPKVRAGANIAR